MKLAVISDIHEDIVNLKKALRLIEKEACDEIACLGDIVGFSSPYYKYHDTRDANECIRLIRENAKYVVAGNHDHYAIRKLPSVVPGFDLPENWYSLSFQQRFNIAGHGLWLYEENELSALLSEESADWISKLPEQLHIPAGGSTILLSHFLSPDITGITTNFLVKTRDFSSHLELMNEYHAHLAFFGHTHQGGIFVVMKGNGDPFIQRKIRISPLLCGVGVPALASSSGFSGFAVYDTEKQIIKVVSVNSGLKLLQT